MKGIVDVSMASNLYRTMLRIRRVEEKISELYPSDRIQSPIHLSIGQEATAAGVCLAMDRTDRLYGTYRSHGIFIAKGGDLKKMFAELYARADGAAQGKGGSMHLVAPEVGLIGCSAIVASTIPVATGDALASARLGRKWVSVAFFGDGALDEGIFYESLNFAALKNLPVIFVCENNGLAVHSKVSSRHRRPNLYIYGEAMGVIGSRHDGNDVFDVYRTMTETIQSVRSGGAPVLLEFMTYRVKEHVGPGEDHQESYRDPVELAAAKASDPIRRAHRVLEELGITADQFDLWEEDIRKEIEEAVSFAEGSPFPDSDDLYRGVFKQPS